MKNDIAVHDRKSDLDGYKIYKTILDSSTDIIMYALDCTYSYLAFNEKHKDIMKRIWGKDIEIGMNILDVISRPDDRKKAKTAFDRALKGESFQVIEEYGGDTFDRISWQSSYSPIYSDQGMVVGLTCLVQDITERIKAETALEQELVFQEALLESLPGYLYVYDEAGRLIKWNKKHEVMTGYNAEELSEMTLDKWFEGEDAERVAAAVKCVFETGYGEVEANLLIKGGGKLLILSNGVRLDIGGRKYFTGIGIDVSKQRKNEETIRRNEAMLQAMVANISDVITIVDEQGNISFKSPNVTKLFGWKPEDLIGLSYIETAHPDDREMLVNEFKRLLLEEGTKTMVEYRYKKKDGSYAIIELAAVNLINNPDVGGILANYHDITDRKQIEKNLRASEEKYRLITENISDVIWVLNLTKNRFTYISPSILQLRGLTAEEAMNESMEDAFAADSFYAAKEALWANTEEFICNPGKNQIFRHEFEQKCKDGKTIWVEATGSYRYNADGELELVGSSHDIRERKIAEEKILHILNHDQLTGLYNRRFYEEEIKKVDTKNNLPITLIMIDINGLKLINDAFGRSFGDALLVQVAELIIKACHKDDIVCRIGGDEFILLLPKTNAEKAEKLIEKIRAAIGFVKHNNVMLSVGIGSATKNDITDDLNEIYKEAEDALYRHKLYESSSMKSKTIELIMNSLFEKNKREMLHSKRVGELCAQIAKNMNFTKQRIDQIRIAGLMHDIGKIGIPDTILNKEGNLNSDEWEQIKRHSEIGYRILSSANEFSEIANFILEHQERWDGTGYPKGLAKDNISLQARIIAVADAYDAMTSDRAYRRGLSNEEAISEILRCSGIQFDPKVVKVFINKVLKQRFAEA